MRILGVLERPDMCITKVLDCPIVGSDNDISCFVDKAEFIVTVGAIKNADTRIRLYNMVKSVGGRCATLVSHTAYVSAYAKVGEGTVVLHRAVINAAASVGVNCIINTGANIEHDVVIGDHTHISTGAMINGGCHIGSGVFIGSGAVLKQGITVADSVIIGAGSVVLNSIYEPGTYYGVIK
jgi:sugar O-acyltransferase (sialic acid O-acetyltransferase NeuD family)